MAGLLDSLLVVAIGALDFGDVVPLEDVVFLRVMAEAALVCLRTARGLKSKLFYDTVISVTYSTG